MEFPLTYFSGLVYGHVRYPFSFYEQIDFTQLEIVMGESPITTNGRPCSVQCRWERQMFYVSGIPYLIKIVG